MDTENSHSDQHTIQEFLGLMIFFLSICLYWIILLLSTPENGEELDKLRLFISVEGLSNVINSDDDSVKEFKHQGDLNPGHEEEDKLTERLTNLFSDWEECHHDQDQQQGHQLWAWRESHWLYCLE